MSDQVENKKSKILYIENLRILLSALVVIVHVACTYGGPGGWTYTEEGADFWTVLSLTILNATSQSFFMGMFFLFGAYFTHLSYQKKGAWRFVKDRFVRLGIPLIITYFLISSYTNYLVLPIRHPESAGISFFEFWRRGYGFGVGVMWFAEALIYFSILYMISRALFPQLRRTEKQPLPKIRSVHIFTAALLLGLVTYFARFEFPLFTGSHGTNFNLGHFPQYIFLFVLGIVAARYSSVHLVNFVQAKKWMWFSLGMVFIGFPMLFFLGGAQDGDISLYLGGATWHSLGFSIWEQVTGVAIMVTLIGVVKEKWNHQSKFATAMSNSAYAVYVFHPPIIVWICILFRDWDTMLLLKFLAITPICLIATYGIAIIIKQMPVLKRIF